MAHKPLFFYLTLLKKIFYKNLYFLEMKNYIYFFAFLLLPFQHLTADPFMLSKKMAGILLNDKLFVYPDTSKKLTIDDIINKDTEFKKVENTPGWEAFPEGAVWLKLTVTNPFDEDLKWLIANEAVWVDHIELYTKDDTRYNVRRGGDLIPFHEREINYRKSAFYVNTKANSTETIYIRMHYEYLDSMFLDTLAYTERELFDIKSNENLLFGLLIGAFWIFAIYNMIIGQSIRDFSYLYFAIYLISNSFFLLTHFGIGFQYIWPNSHYMTTHGLFLIWNTVILTGIKMMQYFLDISKTRWMKLTSDIWFAFTAFSLFIGAIGFYQAAYYFSYASTYFAVIYTLFSYIRWREGMKDARYFLISWIFFFVGLFTNVARELSYVQPSGFSMWAYPLGFLTQACFISLAFTQKINTMREEKENLHAEKQNLLENSKNELEKEVNIRTKQLRESELRYKILIENSPDAIVVHNAKGIVFVNESAVKLIRAKNKKQLMKKQVEDFIHPDSLGAINKRLKKLLANPEMILPPEEHKLIGFDSQILDFESVVALFSFNEKPAFLSIIRDITDRKRVERLRKDTEQILRHDIRNPLFAVTGFSELLMDKEMPENIRDYASNINDAGNQILDMLTSSMDIFKMEEGTFVPKNEKIDMVKTINEVKKEFIPALENKSIKIVSYFNKEIFSDDSEIFLYGQTLHIKSMLRNIIKNAIEASSEKQNITLNINDKKNSYEINIHNHGAIPESIRNRFFDRYATSGKESGTGLGAYSALLIARAHKGNITFTSSKEKGTNITIDLPKKQANA